MFEQLGELATEILAAERVEKEVQRVFRVPERFQQID